MRGQARSISWGFPVAFRLPFSSCRSFPVIPGRKPCQAVSPPTAAGPDSGHRIPAFVGVRSLQPHRFTYSNWLHNNSFKPNATAWRRLNSGVRPPKRTCCSWHVAIFRLVVLRAFQAASARVFGAPQTIVDCAQVVQRLKPHGVALLAPRAAPDSPDFGPNPGSLASRFHGLAAA